MNPKCPCTKDCPNRTQTCHSDCEPFKAYDTERVKERLEDKYDPWFSAHRRSVDRWNKRQMHKKGRWRMFEDRQVMNEDDLTREAILSGLKLSEARKTEICGEYWLVFDYVKGNALERLTIKFKSEQDREQWMERLRQLREK